MNPAIFAGVLAALIAASQSSSSRNKPDQSLPSGAAVAILVWLTIIPLFMMEIGLLLAALADGRWADATWAGLFASLSALILFPGPIVRRLLIPAGRPRLAWALSRLSFWVWRRDVRGGAVVAAALAAMRRTALSPELLSWIERRREALPPGNVRWRLGGAGIVATGFLAAARGDRGEARRLLSSAGELAGPTWPPRAVELAWEWLCAEAIERASWREVEFLARTAPAPTPTTEFLGAVAARLTGIAPLPNDTLLRWRWFAAPQRLRTRPLLLRALGTPATAKPKSNERVTPELPRLPERDSLRFALGLHAFTLGRDPQRISYGELARLAGAWDRAFVDADLDRLLLERGLALGAKRTAEAKQALRDQVRDDLLALVRAAGLELHQLADDSELLGRAARELHSQLLDGLETATSALEARVSAKRELPAIDEWHAFLAIREQYAKAVALGGPELRRLGFQEVHGPLCSLAVWLWNERSERAVGNAMFQWLLAEAVILDDAEAIRLQERNVKCGV